jgi:hypothetical protein
VIFRLARIQELAMNATVNVAHIMLLVGISLIIALISIIAYSVTGKSFKLITRTTRLKIVALSLIMGGVLTYWIVLWQMSILPASVNLNIERPHQDQVGFQERIRVSSSPSAKRVYLLIHPHSTQLWFLQNTLPLEIVDRDNNLEIDDAVWVFQAQFGTTEDSDCNEKYDILALASRDEEWIYFFRGRLLTEGAKINLIQMNLPPLNSSDQVVVTKICP